MFLTQFYHRYKLTSSDVNLFAFKKNKVYHQLGPLCFFFLVLLLGFIFIFCLRYPKYNLRPERENKCLVFGFNKSAGFSFSFYFFLREIKVKPGQGPTDTDKRFFSHPAPLSRQLTDGYTERTENFHGYRSLLVQSIQHLT